MYLVKMILDPKCEAYLYSNKKEMNKEKIYVVDSPYYVKETVELLEKKIRYDNINKRYIVKSIKYLKSFRFINLCGE